MLAEFLEAKPRDFNLTSVPGLPKEAREAVNEALKAMSAWRNEIADTSGKNGKRVIEKMAAAAKALGWPEQIVDATRTQMLSAAEMQIKTIDHMIDAWEEQVKLPNPMTTSPSAMLSKLKTLPGFAPIGSWPGAAASQGMAAMNPLQFWMQLGEHWQKACADTMTVWGKRINLS
jgi:hypothetical protein